MSTTSIAPAMDPEAIASVISAAIATVAPESTAAVATAIASAVASAIASGDAYSDNPENACSVMSQPDLFGMGIRISLYIQWYTTVLAYLYDSGIATECTVVNYCFSIAIAIASLVHPKDLHAHEVIIVAMILLVPPIIIIVAMADNFISVCRPLKFSRNPMRITWEPAEKSNPDNPRLDQGDVGLEEVPVAIVKRHSGSDWLREIAVVAATMFLLIVSVWEFFIGVKVAKHVVECNARFIYSHYLNGRYERFLKVFSVASSIITPLMLGILIWLRTIPGQEVTHLYELDTPDHPNPQPTWRDRVITVDLPYSPLRSDSPIIGPIKVRNVVAFCWGVVVSFVIAQTETIIKQNGLRDVMDPSQTGQLIPLTIGVCQFGIIVHRAWVSGKEKEGKPLEPGERNLQRDVRNSGQWAKRVVLCRPANPTPD
ncbi:hypothetical protein Q9L58_004647 [Maublancomyces gigas]|uniref:Uncharacterized protein n=1 Tax=Discina gigas TaxID=1032678 RepID=A0ABR3GKD5_9PEZI